MTEMTPAQLTHEVDRLTEEVRQMKNLLALFMVNGLQDAFDGTGNQTFGGGVMRLNKNGVEIKAPSLATPTPAVWFRNVLSASDPAADTDRASLSGYADSETGIAMISINGSLQASVGAYANDSSGEAIVYVQQALLLYSLGADPSFLVDGMIWYRSDLDTFRVRANGLTKTVTVA